jgi:hypothetical protein
VGAISDRDLVGGNDLQIAIRDRSHQCHRDLEIAPTASPLREESILGGAAVDAQDRTGDPGPRLGGEHHCERGDLGHGDGAFER